MKTSLFASVALLSFGLVGCGQQARLEVNELHFKDISSALFFSETQTLSLDGEEENDTVSQLWILASERADMCDLLTETIREGGDLSRSRAFENTGAVLVSVTKVQLNSPDGGFLPGDSILGGLVFDEDTGEFLDGGATVQSTHKFPRENEFARVSQGLGSLELHDISVDSLSADLSDFIFDNPKDLDLFLSVKNADLCPALGLLF